MFFQVGTLKENRKRIQRVYNAPQEENEIAKFLKIIFGDFYGIFKKYYRPRIQDVHQFPFYYEMMAEMGETVHKKAAKKEFGEIMNYIIATLKALGENDKNINIAHAVQELAEELRKRQEAEQAEKLQKEQEAKKQVSARRLYLYSESNLCSANKQLSRCSHVG